MDPLKSKRKKVIEEMEKGRRKGMKKMGRNLEFFFLSDITIP